MIKRGREEPEVDTASYLMLLSKVGQPDSFVEAVVTAGGRTFTCKTCSKKFTSFQALGGHRASHKKPKLAGEDLTFELPSTPPKRKTHECPICGLEFPIGQVLGGHMRRHRAAIENKTNNNNITLSSSTSNGSTVSTGNESGAREISPVPEVMKAPSYKIFGVDLSLAPVGRMDSKLELGKAVMTPRVLDLFV